MSVLTGELRLAIRGLRRAPRFSITALLMLTLSIAAATLTFSVVNGVLLRELPYPDADRLFYLHWRTQSGALHALSASKISFWRRYSRTVDSFAASDLATAGVNIAAQDGAAYAQALHV